MSGMVTGIATGLFGALLGGINDWLTARRADKNAKELGRTTAEAENARRGQAEVAAARAAGDDMRDDLARNPDRVREPDAHAVTRGDDGIS